MIVGTAGHIDHGKTALVKALTGVDADRLAEEKARGISIDLGFAYLPRPDGSVLGFVDVPGHERFMKTMLAGATGIDFVLLVVAADDGVMPQTREHLAVVELLGLTRGAVVLTKCDRVDAAQAGAVEAQVRALLGGGPLAGLPVLHTSATTGTGMADLLAVLDRAASETNAMPDNGAFRFVVDRSFSLPGTGTVVTGVVRAGALAVGDTVTISPAGLAARVRGLHVQNRPAQAARRGDRCGINLGRTDVPAVQRGAMLVDAALHGPTARIDAELHLLGTEQRPLRHWSMVRVHHGAAEAMARVAVLQEQPLAPGQACMVQLVLDAPIAAAAMDCFVIRNADAARTIGGGRFVDLRPPQRRRKQPRRLEQLAAMAVADPAESLARQLDAWPWFVDLDRFLRDRGLGADQARAVLTATDHVAAVADGRPCLFSPAVWQRLAASVLGEVRLFHARYPQLLGPNLQRLAQALGPRLPPQPALAVLDLLVRQGALAREAGVYRLPGHRLGLDRGDEAIWQAAQAWLGGDHRFRPQRVAPLADLIRARDFDLRRVLKAMVRQGQVVEIAADHFFLRSTMAEVAGMAGDLAQDAEQGLFGAAQLRDRLERHGQGVGRKVVIQMLEHFDRLGLTVRRGDLRRIDPRRLAAYVGSNGPG